MVYKMKKIRKLPGFTLIEMAIVLFIISLLILIILPNLNGQRKHATSVSRNALANVIQTQSDLYQNEHNGETPHSLADLVSEKYLTEQQVKQAEQQQISFRNGQIEK